MRTTATVDNTDTALTPTGSVQFYVDATPEPGLSDLNNGTAEFDDGQLSAGFDNITAQYIPDAPDFQLSMTTTPYVQQVNVATTMTTVSTGPSPSGCIDRRGSQQRGSRTIKRADCHAWRDWYPAGSSADRAASSWVKTGRPWCRSAYNPRTTSLLSEKAGTRISKSPSEALF